MKENIFKVFSEIKLDIEGSNLGQVGWLPSESDLDYMPIEECNLMKGAIDMKTFIKKCYKIIKHDSLMKGIVLKKSKLKN